MAIANYEALGKLLKEGDYNVRVTVKGENQADGAFIECIRDSIGGGIVHSELSVYVTERHITRDGKMYGGSFVTEGKNLISKLKPDIHDSIGIRIDLVTDKGIRSWVIIR